MSESKIERSQVDNPYQRNLSPDSFKNRSFDGGRITTDAYTGKQVYYSANGVSRSGNDARHYTTKTTSNVDHVTPIDVLIERYGDKIPVEDLKIIANSDYNLAITNEALNKQKGGMTNLEFLLQQLKNGTPENAETTIRMLSAQLKSETNIKVDISELLVIFAFHSSGKMEVLHNGLIDLELSPKVTELAELCPVQAIKIVDPQIKTQDKNEALKEFNQLVNHELRDFPFKAPSYYDYAYKDGVYTALQIPAHYRSEAKYLTDETAENAGIREFKNAIFPQKNNIVSITSPREAFSEEISEFCNTIKAFSALSVCTPYPDNFDTDYNDDYRFNSESSCLKAADNRRDRAYNEGIHFIENLPDAFNTAYLKAIQKQLTEWKRSLLDIYDNNGQPYPHNTIQLKVGNSTIPISLSDHSDIPLADDYSIKRYFEEHISFEPRWESVNGVKYAYKYDCKVDTHYDCDFKETIFGNIKEVNKKYGYDLNLYTFVNSAWEVSKACGEKLAASDFIKNYIGKIKANFLSEVYDAVASADKA